MTPPPAPQDALALSPAVLAQRAGVELSHLATDLRVIEATCIAALLAAGRADPAALQAFDPLIQRLDAMARVLSRLPPHLPATPDPALGQIVLSLRLAQVTDALFGRAPAPSPPAPQGAELF